VELGEFSASNRTSVDNMFAARGLEALASVLAAAPKVKSTGLTHKLQVDPAVYLKIPMRALELTQILGQPCEFQAPGRANVTRIAGLAAELKKSIVARMWNGRAFCDGICEEVGGHSRLMTAIFSLCFGMVPEANVASVWKTVADWGLEEIGDYGAFWYLMAVSGGGYYSQQYDTPDDGTAMLTALTKCDRYSWCAGLRDDNLTMTRESWCVLHPPLSTASR
jgi:hypothetical protein